MNRRLLSILLVLAITIEIFSLVTYITSFWRDIGFFVISGIIIWIGWRRPAVVGYIMVGELLLGGKGYLFFASVFGQTISIRQAIFFVATVLAIRQYRRSPVDWRLIWSRFRWPILLGAWIIMASGWGLFQGYPIGRVFLDMNAYIFLLAWPVIYLLWRGRDHREVLFHIIAAAAIILALKSWILVVLFGQDYSWLTSVYRWVRNTGVGEIVPINSDIMRVFMQSQVYGALAIWIWLERWRSGKASKTVMWGSRRNVFFDHGQPVS